MEEYEKRRERLKAMRVEAAEAGVGANSDHIGLESAGLSNPLVDKESTSHSPTRYTSPRFDYYTDPMAAFSGSRRNNIAPQVLQGYYNTPLRPAYQGMTPPSSAYPSQRVDSPLETRFQIPRPHSNQSPLGNQMEAAAPSYRPQWNNPSNVQGGLGGHFNFPTPRHSNQSPLGNRMEAAAPSYGPQWNNPSNVQGGSGGYFNFHTPSLHHDPGIGQGNPLYASYGRGRGRGQRFNSSPHYDSGRGRGRSIGGRRGAGLHEPVSAEQCPDLYYRKEMVEDPWKLLSPIVWKGVSVRDFDKSWLPKSISSKKAKVSGEAPQTSISQQSLAEYLAASFNDSTDEAVDDEQTA